MDDKQAARGRWRHAVIAGPAGLILLAACGGSHGTITALTPSPSSPSPASASPSSASPSSASPSRPPSSTAAQPTQDPPVKVPVLIAAPASNGVRRLLTVSSDGKVSLSGTTADETTRLVLRPTTTGGTEYLIMSPLHSAEKDAYCLNNDPGTGPGTDPEGHFSLAVCDRTSLTQVFSFSPSYEGDGFVVAAPYGAIMAKGTRAYTVVSEQPTHFTVTADPSR